MVTDFLIDFMSGLVTLILAPLPEGHLDLPSPEGLANAIGGIDSLIPILGPLHIALTILGAVTVFITVRLVLVVVNIIWP